MLFSKTSWAIKLPAALLLGLTFSLWQPLLSAAEAPTIIAAPMQDTPKTASALQTTVVAGGCFWGLQGAAIIVGASAALSSGCHKLKVSPSNKAAGSLIVQLILENNI